MALSTTLIEVAMAYNAANPSQSQADAHHRLATAIVSTIEAATLTYASGLIAPSGGGPVTGTLSTVIIS